MVYNVRYVYFSESGYEYIIEISIRYKDFKFLCKIPTQFLVELTSFYEIYQNVDGISSIVYENLEVLGFVNPNLRLWNT